MARESKSKKRRWDNRYLELAQHISQWSKDPNAQVGAVLLDAQKRVCALGYNGFPRSVEDSETRLQNKDTKLDMIMHAEANAITIAGRGAVGGEIYVFGKPVCAQCAGLIIQSGIKRVVAQEPTPGTDSRWDQVGVLAKEILRETRKIKVDLIPRAQLMARVLPVRTKKAKKSPPTEPLFEYNIASGGTRADSKSRHHVIKDTGSAVAKAAIAKSQTSESPNSVGRRRRAR